MPWYFPWSDSIKKRACRYLLQHYMGKFLKEKLSLDQLSVDLYNGKGTIHDVLLDVLVSIGLPAFLGPYSGPMECSWKFSFVAFHEEGCWWLWFEIPLFHHHRPQLLTTSLFLHCFESRFVSRSIYCKYCDFEGIYGGISEGLGQSVYFPEVPWVYIAWRAKGPEGNILSQGTEGKYRSICPKPEERHSIFLKKIHNIWFILCN